MGSSVITGVDGILKIFPDLDAIAILLADQPCIATDHLAKMQSIFATSNVPILAANYAGTVGVPALFRSSLFPKLKELAPDAGARTLLREGNTDVQHYDLPEAAIDIDTPEDFAALG
jgi:molybdenum cofactor cytidylyltransferase